MFGVLKGFVGQRVNEFSLSCLSSTELPTASAGTAARITSQARKFHGMIFTLTKSGNQVTITQASDNEKDGLGDAVTAILEAQLEVFTGWKKEQAAT